MHFLALSFNDFLKLFPSPACVFWAGVAVLGSLSLLAQWLKDVKFPPKGSPPKRENWLQRLRLAVILVLFIALPDDFGREVFAVREVGVWPYIGKGLLAFMVAIVLVSLWFLRRQFSPFVKLQKDHKLIQSGPYRLVRHPIYLGYLMALPGVLLISCKFMALPMFVLNLLGILRQVRKEEELLAGHFGEEFEAYRRRTWRLIPYIY